MKETTVGSGPHAIEVRRTLTHPPERVFDAWLDAEGMSRWMIPGPEGRTEVDLDPRVGGSFRIDMIQGEKRYEHHGEFLIIDRPDRLVFTWRADWLPGGSTVTITLRGVEGGTEMVLRHDGLPDQVSADSHRGGWTEFLEALAAELGVAG